MPPIIYLDQNHWITLARARHARHKVQHPDELTAADALWKMAAKQEIRLPLSVAHLVETARAGGGQRRAELADTMLEAYHGWHMSHPVDVRAAEIAAVLSGEAADVEVFSRQPGTPFLSSQFEPFHSADPELTEDAQRLVDALVWRDTWNFALRHETQSSEQNKQADVVIEGWARSHQEFQTYLAEHPAERDPRQVAAAWTLGDLRVEISMIAHDLGLSPEDFAATMSANSVLSVFSVMPFIARVTEITHLRFRDSNDSWKRNDLNDLMYAICAAGYADFVVADNKFAHLANQASKHSPPGATVTSNLRTLWADLQAAVS
ncbi:hypothetical protein [Streptosporangium sp. NPDC002524]|uniref:hypothetical protein n=1 Tax=Streptosporangium sp. NPDC002524 TaxID=3154537 RepID=UPI003332D550